MTAEFKPKITYRMAGMHIDSGFNQRYDWCLENLGPALDYPPRWQPIGNLAFKFRDPKDEMWFKLRWTT